MRTRATPWDRDRGVEHSAAIRCHMTPLFWGGVALVPALHAALGRRERAVFKLDNHSGMSDIDGMRLCRRPERISLGTPPPLTLFH